MNRKISQFGILLGVTSCLLGVIWSPEDALKWLGTAAYLYLVGNSFGLTYRKEKVVGERIQRCDKHIVNFLPMRKV